MSLKNGKRYIGYTGKTAEQRLSEHNGGSNIYTSSNRPFVLCYKETYNDKTIAIKREKFLKSGKGREFVDNILRA